MNKQQGMAIVEGLRKAQAAGAAVVELEGTEARDFNWVTVEERKELLGSFCLESERKLYVLVVSTTRSTDDFQFMVYEKFKGSPVLASSFVEAGGIVWTYQATKQTGDNQARKRAFRELAKSDAILIPFPSTNITSFTTAVTNAIDLRRAADAAGDATEGDDATASADRTVRYWKISPGEGGKNWEECRDGGFIGIGWNKLGDLTNLTEEEFKVRADEQGGSDQVWTFRNISIGDRIVANQGTKRVLGIGTVTGSYYFDENGAHKHRLRVRWDDTTERAVLKKSWFKTLIPIKPQDFEAIENAPPVDLATEAVAVPESSHRNNALTFEAILEQLRDASLSFSAELVASYLLALQAKRFVLLTGISGTGKTQLALAVARAFDEALVASDTEPLTEAFEIVAKPYQINHLRFIVPSELAQTFDALSDPETKRIDLKLPGLKKASMAFYKNAERGNLFEVLLSGDSKAWFKENIKIGDRYRLLRQVSGAAEWLELQLSSPGKRSRPAAPAGRTFAAIAVRPNWTDKSEILGFYNPLTNKYQKTKILDFLMRAHAEVEATDGSPRPYFLIFDEMNLARVEHYFSDFLSAMESGQAIDLHDDPQLEDSQGIPRYLTVPKNLFVVGTVNIDETTYMFSPKVLDRAFVLEFNDVNFDGIGKAIEEEAPSSTPLALESFERLEVHGKASEAEWQAFEQVLAGELLARLRKLHDALAVEHRHFGYRVAREIARFVNLAVAQTGDEAGARAAFDVAVLAKILPKLHGSQNELEALLKRLLAVAIDERPEADVFANGSIRPELLSQIPLPRSATKLSRMLRRLSARGFVSYIE